MASIIMRTKGKQDYHYLTHKTSIRQYEKYLGKKIPEKNETIIIEIEL